MEAQESKWFLVVTDFAVAPANPGFLSKIRSKLTERAMRKAGFGVKMASVGQKVANATWSYHLDPENPIKLPVVLRPNLEKEENFGSMLALVDFYFGSVYEFHVFQTLNGMWLNFQTYVSEDAHEKQDFFQSDSVECPTKDVEDDVAVFTVSFAMVTNHCGNDAVVVTFVCTIGKTDEQEDTEEN